jgi:hypothetical protein
MIIGRRNQINTIIILFSNILDFIYIITMNKNDKFKHDIAPPHQRNSKIYYLSLENQQLMFNLKKVIFLISNVTLISLSFKYLLSSSCLFQLNEKMSKKFWRISYSYLLMIPFMTGYIIFGANNFPLIITDLLQNNRPIDYRI